ncbi:6-bladed beta-propeller, partial [Candidatus Aminicenantes bacterium AC-335-G13]|nr:6-bladed beta-propeller [Candidatus Aminicenantes bacterium AC-335-G13]
KVEELKLIRVLPVKEERVFFKTTPFIVVDNFGNVYAVDNREHTVYKFDRNGKLLQKIGRKGEGPGDLEFPVHICVRKDKVFISDNRAISIFDLNGKFINRFRKFRHIISMAVFRDTILLTESSAEKLINVYDFKGKKLNSFGEKYKVDYSIYKGWPKAYIDQMINRGKILCSNNYIFYISYAFGDVFGYSASGKLLFKKEIKNIDFIKKSRQLLFKIGGKINKRGYYILKRKDWGYFLNDAFYFKNKIYLLLSENYLRFSKRDISKGEIWQFDVKTGKIERKFYFYPLERDKINKIYTRSLAIRKNENNKLLIYISYYDDRKGDFFIGKYIKQN